MRAPRPVTCLVIFLAALSAQSRLSVSAAEVRPCAGGEEVAEGAALQLTADEGAADTLTIVVVGDTGFNRSNAPVRPDGFLKGEKLWRFDEAAAPIAPEIDGDLAFANIETVVTDRNDIGTDAKEKDVSFHFRSHPAGVDALIDIGFNLFSLANNHSMDHGAAGAEETLYHMALARHRRPIAFAGLGANLEEATRPACLEIGGDRIGFSAIGIVTGSSPQHRAGETSHGQASYRNPQDFQVTLDRLSEMPADYRILSVHQGSEGRVVPDARQIDDFRNKAAGAAGIDLVLGHHPHVAQGVEIAGDAVIFHGLGNFLHPGTANMAAHGICRDYGLMAKLHLARGPTGRFEPKAIEAIPLTMTYQSPRRFAPDASRLRIEVLNYLGSHLGDGRDAKGIGFTPQADGSGLYCAEGAAEAPGRIGALCAGWQAPVAPQPSLTARIAEACKEKRPEPPKKERSPFPFNPFSWF